MRAEAYDEQSENFAVYLGLKQDDFLSSIIFN